MRWAEELSRFNFTIRYRPGREGTIPEVLSRRDQDMPVGAHDRYAHREAVLLRPEIMKDFTAGSLRLNRPALALVATPVHVSPPSDADAHFSVDSTAPDAPNRPDTHPSPAVPHSLTPASTSTTIGRLWQEAKLQDTHLAEIKESIRRGDRRFSPALRVGASMSECSVDEDGDVCFRNRKWVPDNEPLRTQIIQEVHDSILSDQPGREGTYRVLSRQFYWPGMSDDNRRFCRNCDRCAANQIWRARKHGLLKPLPIPERKWRFISMDFIETLPVAGVTSISS